jgi:hypothetical protein
MIDVTLPVDAELVVIAYLRSALLDALGVGIDVRGGGLPDQPFVRVRRIGGAEESLNHDKPILDVIVWHVDDKQRMSLALQLWTLLRAAAGDEAAGGVIMYDSTMLGPRQMPDPVDATNVVCMFSVSLIIRPA